MISRSLPICRLAFILPVSKSSSMDDPLARAIPTCGSSSPLRVVCFPGLEGMGKSSTSKAYRPLSAYLRSKELEVLSKRTASNEVRCRELHSLSMNSKPPATSSVASSSTSVTSSMSLGTTCRPVSLPGSAPVDTAIDYVVVSL